MPRIWILALSLLVIPACRPSNSGTTGDDRPLVVSTIAQIDDLVRQIAGDDVRRVVLMGPGVDPHLYQPSRTDIVILHDADLVLANGLMLEGRMGDVLGRLENADRAVAYVGESIGTQHLIHPERADGHADPHIWMDPTLWAEVAGVIGDALAEMCPDQADAIKTRTATLSDRLRAMDVWTASAIGSIPEDRRVLITAHDAFAYLGRRYDVDVRGIQGISTESEAGLRHIERLVDTIVELQVPAVFIETTVPDRSVNALLAGAKARDFDVRIGGELFSDAMGAPGTPEGTYVGMIVHNVSTITKALGGTVPEQGF